MHTSNDLRGALRAIDHRSYPAYKSLAGRWSFGRYILGIDHVQGDPFAAPSSLSLRVDHREAGFPAAYWEGGKPHGPGGLLTPAVRPPGGPLLLPGQGLREERPHRP